jgi:hypothetical protein
MNTNAHGYSGKPLYQKLGLKSGMRCLALNPPAHYRQLVDGVEGVRFLDIKTEAEFVHLFCPDRKTLECAFKDALSLVSEGGMLWVSWPKKSSALFKDLTEDNIREIVLPSGWVDVKVCAVDQDWSALKFLRRKN